MFKAPIGHLLIKTFSSHRDATDKFASVNSPKNKTSITSTIDHRSFDVCLSLGAFDIFSDLFGHECKKDFVIRKWARKVRVWDEFGEKSIVIIDDRSNFRMVNHASGPQCNIFVTLSGCVVALIDFGTSNTYSELLQDYNDLENTKEFVRLFL